LLESVIQTVSRSYDKLSVKNTIVTSLHLLVLLRELFIKSGYELL